ncbi:MAG: Bacterial alpha-L-rhamnosidase [Lentisphaerae bacterium ADurb.Bin242]|nr:MAG: Bacterial alpha-L-rhamnosidase [Lentisphaerae bacterium ADurb.Bin242]
MNFPTFVTHGDGAMVYCELNDVKTTFDTFETLPGGDEWPEGTPLFAGQVGCAEFRDLRLEPVGWLDGTDHMQWLAPEKCESVKKCLPRPVPLLAVTQHRATGIAHTAIVEKMPKGEFPAEAITFAGHGDVDRAMTTLCHELIFAGEHNVVIGPPSGDRGVSLVFGFSEEIIGSFELDVTTPAGVVVDFGYAEALSDNGRMKVCRNRDPLDYHLADRLTTREGRQTLGTSILQRGFRYVEVVFRHLTGSVILHRVVAVDRRYPATMAGTFFCSDMLLNRIWGVCAETLGACTTDVFTDCPWRERAFWVNDFMVENPAALHLFGDYRMNAHALSLAFSNRRDDGLIPGVVPYSGGPNLVLPATDLQLALIVHDYYWYSGDLETTRKLIPELLKTLKFFHRRIGRNDLISPPVGTWNFVDWAYELSGLRFGDKHTSLLNFFYVMACDAAAELLEATGSSVNSVKTWRRHAEKVRKALRLRFRTPDGIYSDFLQEDGTPSRQASELGQALATLSGTELQRPERPGLLVPELYMHYFLLKQFQREHHAQEGLRRLRRYWGDIVRTGTPTLWEAGVWTHGSAAFGGFGSLCHGFSCSPLIFCHTALLGVRPLEPGFRRFSVDPDFGDLEFARGGIPTPNGIIQIRWERNSHGSVTLELNVPFGLTAVTPFGECGSGFHRLCWTI